MIVHQIVITQDDQGRVEVTGPIDNLFVCHALLGCAAKSINDNATKSMIERPHGLNTPLRA